MRYGGNYPDDYNPNRPGSPEYGIGRIAARCGDCANAEPCPCGCRKGWCCVLEEFVDLDSTVIVHDDCDDFVPAPSFWRREEGYTEFERWEMEDINE